MWKPKYMETKQKAESVARTYKEAVDNGMSSYRAAVLTSASHDVSLASVYRYLRVSEIKLPKRVRDKRGRFAS